MSDKILNMSLRQVEEFSTSQSLAGNFLVFDNYSGPLKEKPAMLSAGHPVKLDFTLVALCLGGTACLRVGHIEFDLEKNDSITIQEGKVFQPIRLSPDFKVCTMCIKYDFLELNKKILPAINLQNLLTENPRQRLTQEEAEGFEVFFGMLKQSMEDTSNLYRSEIVHSFFDIMFYNVCNRIIRTNDPSSKVPSRKEEIFQRFIFEVEKNFKKERSVGFYADKICLTPKYLSTVVREQTGEHASYWIDYYTILEAKALLKSSYLTVQQISDELNFTNPSHFGRYFKRLSGMSPRAYRKSGI